jgi:hypothetical protein
VANLDLRSARDAQNCETRVVSRNQWQWRLRVRLRIAGRELFCGRITPAESNFSLVSNEQLYLAVGIPLLFNATLIGLLIAYVNAKFQGIDSKFNAINTRFDDIRDLWRSELHRVEGVLDARLNRLEERG